MDLSTEEILILIHISKSDKNFLSQQKGKYFLTTTKKSLSTHRKKVKNPKTP